MIRMNAQVTTLRAYGSYVFQGVVLRLDQAKYILRQKWPELPGKFYAGYPGTDALLYLEMLISYGADCHPTACGWRPTVVATFLRQGDHETLGAYYSARQ
eukprot:2306051-Rhodomonas_salina.1